MNMKIADLLCKFPAVLICLCSFNNENYVIQLKEMRFEFSISGQLMESWCDILDELCSCYEIFL